MTDDIGVVAVELYVDGAKIATATSVAAPWSFAWDTRATTNKSHTLRTRACDTSGNTALGAAITVTVANSRFAATAAPAPAPARSR